MKVFSSELVQSYPTYSFGYCNYAIRENHDTLTEILQQGYLPYSGARTVKSIYYMARSLRINLATWHESSENRRILGRFTTLTREEHALADFDFRNEAFLTFCLDYFVKRHGPEVMPKQRLLHFLESGFVTHILTYSIETKPIAYVFLAEDATSTHYPYAFYHLDYAKQSLGMWLMIDSVTRAQKKKQAYMYLGTIYGQKALYKTNFYNLEFWNGHMWVANRHLLRARCKTDTDRSLVVADEWKSTFPELLFNPPR